MTTGVNKPAPPAISCVIPAYNAAQSIARALASVIDTEGIAEVIVVDDGSQDNTAKIVEGIAATASIPVYLFKQKNGGASAARNTGLRATQCAWVAFLDSDDEMLPEAIISKVAHLASCHKNSEVAAVYGSFVRGDTGQNGQFSVTHDQVERDGIGRRGGFPGGVHSYVFRRDVLIGVNGFREDLILFEDFELILRMLSSGARMVGCDQPGFLRHYTPNSLSRGTTIDTRLHIERKFLRIAWQDGLLSRQEIARRLLRNLARNLYFTLSGK